MACGDGGQQGGQFTIRLGHPASQVETATSYTCGTGGLLHGVPGMMTKIGRSVSFVNVVSRCLPTVSEQYRLSNVDCLPAVNNDHENQTCC